jgi:hypothetical protein
MIVGSSRKYIGSLSCYVEVICRLLMHRLCRSHTIVDYQEVPQDVYDLGFAPAGGGKGIGSGGSCSGDGGGSGSGDGDGKGGTIGKGGGKDAQAARGLKRPCSPAVPPAGTAARSAAEVASAAAAGEDRRAIIHIVKHCLTRGLRPTVISNSNIIDISFV